MKNWFVILLMLLMLMLFGCIIIERLRYQSEADLRGQTELQLRAAELERDKYREMFDSSQVLAQHLRKRNDSLLQVITLKESALLKVRTRNKEILDSISNIPAESSYEALQELLPVPDSLPRLFPFAAPQVKKMHTAVVFVDIMGKEYDLMASAYDNCRELNKGLAAENRQLFISIDAVNNELTVADRQIDLLMKNNKRLNNELRNSRIVKYGLGGLALFFGVVAAL